jgi:hypothetical protein
MIFFYNNANANNIFNHIQNSLLQQIKHYMEHKDIFFINIRLSSP